MSKLFLKSRPDLFPPESRSKLYTLQRYHIMGSRILSRSFQVSKWDGAEGEKGEDPDDMVEEANKSIDSAAMDVDEQPTESPDEVQETLEEDDEDEDDPANVAMVPMADMLNARFESENVCRGFLIIPSMLRSNAALVPPGKAV